MNRLFFYPDYQRYVLFTAPALEHMYRCRQRWVWQKEAGGELFAVDPGADGIIITAAMGPAPEDYRARYAFNPNVEAGYRERVRQFNLGLHAVGLWHTHPEKNPKPSGLDQRTTEDYLNAFLGDRERYLMAIIGNRGDFPNMQVWSASRSRRARWYMLQEIDYTLSISKRVNE